MLGAYLQGGLHAAMTVMVTVKQHPWMFTKVGHMRKALDCTTERHMQWKGLMAWQDC